MFFMCHGCGSSRSRILHPCFVHSVKAFIVAPGALYLHCNSSVFLYNKMVFFITIEKLLMGGLIQEHYRGSATGLHPLFQDCGLHIVNI